MGDNTALRRSLLREQAGACFYCGRQMVMDLGNLAVTVDHRLPKGRGGPDRRDNIVGACWQCNALKGSMTEDEFVASREALVATVGLPVHGLCGVNATRIRREARSRTHKSFDPIPVSKEIQHPIQPGPGSLGDFWPSAQRGPTEPNTQPKDHDHADRFHCLPAGPTGGTAFG
jgi:hypothetical protein